MGDAYGGMKGGEWMNSLNSPHATEKVKNQLERYLAGVAHGIEIMDVMLEAKGHNIRFFCVPDKLALITSQKVNMLKGNLGGIQTSANIHLALLCLIYITILFPVKTINHD